MSVSEAILFDLDGVLVDSDASVRRSWRRWAAEQGLDATLVETFAQGRRGRDVVEHWAPQLDPVTEEERLIRGQIEDSADVTAIPGAAELLASLAPGSWAIVTSGTRELALTRIRRARLGPPQVLIAAEDVAVGKPAPEGYLRAARELDASPADCVVVEDAPAGIEAGLAAGMVVVAITTTFPREALQRAHRCVARLGDVLPTLRA